MCKLKVQTGFENGCCIEKPFLMPMLQGLCLAILRTVYFSVSTVRGFSPFIRWESAYVTLTFKTMQYCKKRYIN